MTISTNYARAISIQNAFCIGIAYNYSSDKYCILYQFSFPQTLYKPSAPILPPNPTFLLCLPILPFLQNLNLSVCVFYLIHFHFIWKVEW